VQPPLSLILIEATRVDGCSEEGSWGQRHRGGQPRQRHRGGVGPGQRRRRGRAESGRAVAGGVGGVGGWLSDGRRRRARGVGGRVRRRSAALGPIGCGPTGVEQGDSRGGGGGRAGHQRSGRVAVLGRCRRWDRGGDTARRKATTSRCGWWEGDAGHARAAVRAAELRRRSPGRRRKVAAGRVRFLSCVNKASGAREWAGRVGVGKFPIFDSLTTFGYSMEKNH
jgi:hypothetical protein